MQILHTPTPTVSHVSECIIFVSFCISFISGEKDVSNCIYFLLYEEIRSIFRRQEFMTAKTYKDLLNIFHWHIHLTSYV